MFRVSRCFVGGCVIIGLARKSDFRVVLATSLQRTVPALSSENTLQMPFRYCLWGHSKSRIDRPWSGKLLPQPVYAEEAGTPPACLDLALGDEILFDAAETKVLARAAVTFHNLYVRCHQINFALWALVQLKWLIHHEQRSIHEVFR